jgi:1-acyl-sn-glycerol-3-phosphate acyltransferase
MSLRWTLGGGDAAIARARRPQALAATLDAPPLQGLDWLGRPPSPEAPLLYRVLVPLGEAFLFGICRLRLTVEGREHLPEGGYIAVCAVHRSWIDPLLLIRALPREPRLWFLGSGPTAFDRRWKERLLHRMGGILPVWRGGPDVAVHARSAAAVVAEGAVLALFMEGGIGGRPDRLARVRHGAAFLALRTGAPIVPVALCGAEGLYRHKRMALRILPPTTAADLLGGDDLARLAAGSREEVRAITAVTTALSERIERAVSELYPATTDPPSAPRRWSWLTRLMR